jgi:glycogen phosphorylase
MFTLHRYHVLPALPEPLAPLVRLAKNLWWSWNEGARELFRRIDPDLHRRVSENPLAVLAQARQEQLDELARDPSYLAAVDATLRELDVYLARPTWFDRHYGGGEGIGASRIGYFSMEFGIHESLPVYSGGLGVLAGDHLKSASDLGLPLVGVGIAFSQGYFRQSLAADGWQNERYPPNDWRDLPVSPVLDADGRRVSVSVALPASGNGGKEPSRAVTLEAWRVDVGRVPLFLLDANIEQNAQGDRALTNTLYGGDRQHRIRQEILLGVGGVRMLRAVGLPPAICHMNEGHSAFLAVERVRELMALEGISFPVAREAAAAGNVFTTHTPVPAGNDAFAADLIAPYLEVLAAGTGLRGAELMDLGRLGPPSPGGGELSMPVLAIRLADRYNGVSALHGREARAMWRVLWPGLAEHEVPIGSITNGVHVGTWIGREMGELFERHLGPGFREEGPEGEAWARVAAIPDRELWEVHERCRARLLASVDARMRLAAERRGLAAGTRGVALDPHALTIGFARRFATYKRGTLLLRDRERLRRILRHEGRPVQLVFSGKAHPQDAGGKELIRDIVQASHAEAFEGRILFLEDYDMSVARDLVAGVDVWLNTPRRPLEASGTSGMKAGLNGVLHASVLDGWWCEAFTGDNGFAIGAGEEYADPEHGDRLEAQALYRLLEQEIVPLFYERDGEGLPRGWIARMKRAIATIAPVFSTRRMVEEYARQLYAPAAQRVQALRAGGFAGAEALAAWKAKVAAAWAEVRIVAVTGEGPEGAADGGAKVETPVDQPAEVLAGRALTVRAEVALGALSPSDVAVDVYYGKLRGAQALEDGAALPMRCAGEVAAGRFRFEATLPTRETGEHAFAVRVLPMHEALPDRFAARRVAWQ